MAAHKPVGTGQTITIGAASTYVEFKQESPYVRIYAKGTDTFVAINTNPTADATGYYIPSNTSAILSMDKVRSNRVVGITTGVGETTLDFAEGTGSPVDVGQLVMLDVTVAHEEPVPSLSQLKSMLFEFPVTLNVPV